MQYLLTIDVGNTELKFAQFDTATRTFTQQWRMSLDDTQHLDSCQGALTETLEHHLSPKEGCVGVSFCSVVPRIEPVLETVLSRTLFHSRAAGDGKILKADPTQIGKGFQCPVSLGNYPPHQLGPDRLVDLVAVQMGYPKRSAVVLDFGTATTIDALSSDGEFLGGIIAPGWRLFMECLPQATARLPLLPSTEDLPPLTTVLGQSTEEAMTIGITTGYWGVIQSLVDQMRREILQTEGNSPEGEPLVIATGGVAQTLHTLWYDTPSTTLPSPSWSMALDPLLTHWGLVHLYEANRSTEPTVPVSHGAV